MLLHIVLCQGHQSLFVLGLDALIQYRLSVNTRDVNHLT